MHMIVANSLDKEHNMDKDKIDNLNTWTHSLDNVQDRTGIMDMLY